MTDFTMAKFGSSLFLFSCDDQKNGRCEFLSLWNMWFSLYHVKSHLLVNKAWMFKHGILVFNPFSQAVNKHSFYSNITTCLHLLIHLIPCLMGKSWQLLCNAMWQSDSSLKAERINERLISFIWIMKAGGVFTSGKRYSGERVERKNR